MKNISPRLCLSIAAACLASLSHATPSWAFQLLPLTQYFSPVGSDSTQSYRVTNNQSQRVAVEVSAMKREIDPLGQEKLFPADDDFIVYPSQIILEPGASQSLRVTWLGEESPETELAYRLVAEQLPISFEKSQLQLDQSEMVASVDILMRYLGSVFIRPADSESNLVLTSAGLFEDLEAKRYIELFFLNTGSEFARLSEAEVQVSSQDKQVLLGRGTLVDQGQKIVLAGGERRLLIPWPAELPYGDVTAKLIVNK